MILGMPPTRSVDEPISTTSPEYRAVSVRLRRARHHTCAALRIATEVSAAAILVDTVPPIALLLADRGEAARAVELYALALRYPGIANSRFCDDVAGRHIATTAETLPPDVVAAAQERGRARDLEATVRELLAELEDQQGSGAR